MAEANYTVTILDFYRTDIKIDKILKSPPGEVMLLYKRCLELELCFNFGFYLYLCNSKHFSFQTLLYWLREIRQ